MSSLRLLEIRESLEKIRQAFKKFREAEEENASCAFGRHCMRAKRKGRWS